MGVNNGPSGFDCYDGPTVMTAGMPMYWASMPSCMMTIGGGDMVCDEPRSGSSQSFSMSDGSTYYRNTSTVGRETTESWTDSSGQTVDAPPPMDDGSYNYPQEQVMYLR